MFLQTNISCKLVVTLITVKLDFFMNSLNMTIQITFSRSFMSAKITTLFCFFVSYEIMFFHVSLYRNIKDTQMKSLGDEFGDSTDKCCGVV